MPSNIVYIKFNFNTLTIEITKVNKIKYSLQFNHSGQFKIELDDLYSNMIHLLYSRGKIRYFYNY